MAVIGFALLWGGYAIAYYGFNRITGGNDSFRSLIWPGDYKPTTRDGGGGSGAPTAALPAVTPTNPVPAASSALTGAGAPTAKNPLGGTNLLRPGTKG